MRPWTSALLLAVIALRAARAGDEVKPPPHIVLSRIPAAEAAAAAGSGALPMGPVLSGASVLQSSVRHPLLARHVLLSPDGKQVLVSVQKSEELLLYNALSGELEARLSKGLGSEGRGSVSAGFTPDNTRICWIEAGPNKGKAQTGRLLVRERSGKKPAVERALGERPLLRWPLVFSPSGKRVAADSYGPKGIIAFDVASGKEVACCRSAQGETQFAFMNETILAGSGERTPASLWDLESGGRLGALGDGYDVAATRDRKLLACTVEGKIVLWNGREGKAVRRFGPMCYGLAFSPDGRHLAAFDYYNRKVNLHEAASGKKVATFPREGGSTASFAYSPDGRRLAWATRTTTIFIGSPSRPNAETSWIQVGDIDGRKRVLLFRHGPAARTQVLPDVKHLVFAADNRTLWVRDDWGVVTVYRLAEAARPRPKK